ncbi:MAG: PD-(D/E)XK nuclease family protein [Mariprofundaceae bacterium]|nr:PD-(D/E)XK nuclease family protein [Mariprofundaceae bacterium]
MLKLTKHKKSTTAIEGDMSDKIKPQMISDNDALNQLSQNSMLITHSPQLASDWKHRYSIKQSLAACETPHVYTWSAWQSKLFQQASDKVCLKEMQEQLLWQQAIKQDLADAAESSIRGLAKQASQAYAIMQSYQIPTQILMQAGGDEAEALARWIALIHAKLEESNYQSYILKADISVLLLTSKKDLKLPASIIFDGFECFTPMQKQHLNMYVNMGIKILQIQQQQSPQSMTLHPCQDEQAEYQHLALQTQAILEKQPQARIALVSVQTSQQSELSELKRYMQKFLNPISRLHPEIQQQSIATQEMLADSPMIQQALHMLAQAAHYELAFEDFSPFLFCPWIRGFEQERMARASLDATFRQQNRHHIQLKSLLKSSELQVMPAFKNCIESISTWQQNLPKKQSAAHWIKACQHLLQRCGFLQAGLAHESARSSYETQLMNALHESITQLIALDAIQESCTWSQFLIHLRSSCAAIHITQPTELSNVMVLNIQQAIAMQFDYALIYGMDDISFPPVPRPQSFLPIRIQQDYHIPMSHSSLVFESCQWLWQQMLHTAPHIIVSYAQLRDEQSMKPSSFVTLLPIEAALCHDTIIEPWIMEDFDDAQLVPVHDIDHIRGGTGIIKHQSACPFRAFAVHRLRIDTLSETSPGIEPSTKGSLIHLALEYIWQQLLTQQKLLDMSDEQRQKLIEHSIEHAWLHNKKPIDFHSQDIEKKRMYGLLQQWLELESQRPPFQIEALEKTYQLSLPTTGKLSFPITIKADRMDKDAHGHRLLIDYKTGAKQFSNQWLGERIAEPQLPIYALAADLSAQDAVSFASLRSGEDMGIKGLTLCDGKRSRPDDWQAVLDVWKQQIDALAEEFIQGRSDVTPRDKGACKYCQLEAICRIDELLEQQPTSKEKTS